MEKSKKWLSEQGPGGGQEVENSMHSGEIEEMAERAGAGGGTGSGEFNAF